MSTFSAMKLDKLDIMIVLPFHNTCIQLQPIDEVNDKFH